MQPINAKILSLLSSCLGHMCTKFQFDLMKMSETTAIQTFGLLLGALYSDF
jgi:hypothetical protein